MRKLLLSLLLPLLFSCGGDANDDGAEGTLTVHLSLQPVPARVGQASLHIHVVDGDGLPVDGATLEVKPWMPSHGHGSPEQPVVEAHGDGVYEAFPITFSMPGPWEIRVKATSGGEHGSATLKVDVEG